MQFRSRYPNHAIALTLPEGHRTVRFSNGALDTKVAAQNLGVTEEALNEALKRGRYYGADYTAIDEPAPRKR